MPIQTVNLGTYANDGTGDDLRSAFVKVNENFDYLNELVAISGANLGAGAPLFASKSGNNLQFRSIAAGSNLTVGYNGTTITVSANNPFVGDVTGNVTGNASTVTNGVYTTSSINALADVDTSTTPPTNGQALVWNTVASQWKPGTVSGGGGGSGITAIIEDTSPQLGGDLDLNGYKIVTSNNGNIELDPNGYGTVIFHGNLTIDGIGNITKTGQLNISPTTLTSFGNNDTVVDGNIYITRNSYSSAITSGLTFAQHHNTADAVNFTFYRTRGTGLSPTRVVNGDDLGDIAFLGWDGTARAGGATISATVEGNPVSGHIPTKLSFFTNNGSTQAIRAELSAIGTWKVNTLSAYSGSTMSVLSNVSIGNNFSLSVGGMTLSQDGLITSTSSNQSITIRSNGIGNVAIEGISITSRQISTDGNYPLQLMSIPQLPTFADETSANAAVGGLPADGMMYYDSGATVIKGYGSGAWHALW